MTRVFVSHAQEDRSAIEAYVSGLREAGYDLWWDGALRAGEDWDKRIEAELKRADCVVIFWSQHSIESPWVRIEAHYARQHDCLVPARLDNADIPDEYRLVQTIDATAGTPDAVLEQIRDAIDSAIRRQRGRRVKLAALWGVVLAGVIALLALVTANDRQQPGAWQPAAEKPVTGAALWSELHQAATLEELETVENRFARLLASGERSVLAHAGLCATSLMRYSLTRRDADLAVAEDSCASARELDGGSAFAAEANGLLAFYRGSPDEAIAGFERALKLDPDSATARVGLGIALEARGRLAEGEQMLREATVARPALWRTHNALALFLQRQGRTEEAIRRFELALALSPTNISILNNLGVSHLYNQDYVAAIGAWDSVLEVTPAPDQGPTLSNIGSAYYLLREYGEAKFAYQQASRLMGDDYRTWDNLADTLNALGETTAARGARQRALDRASLIYSQNGGDYLALASIAAAKSALGTDGWRRDIDGALAAGSADPEAHRIAALAYLRADNRVVAAKHYAESLKLGYPEFLLVADYQFDPISDAGISVQQAEKE